MMQPSRDFNGVAKFFLALSVFAQVINVVNSMSSLSLYSSIGGGAGSIVAELLLSALIIVAAVLTFMKKQYGLIALIALFVIRIFATIPTNTTIAYSYYLGGKTAIFLRDFAPFAIAMCFKKDGVSGWKSMLASNAECCRNDTPDTPTDYSINKISQQDSDEQSFKESREEDVLKSSDNEATEVKTTPMGDVTTSISTIEENVSNNVSEQQVDSPQMSIRDLSFKTKILLGLALFTVITCFVTIIAVSSRGYPEYITSFRDKWKYSFNRPNNKLASKLYNEARHKGGFFFVNGEDTFRQDAMFFYNNKEDNLKKYSSADVYYMLDTIKTKYAIKEDEEYAARYHDSYTWGKGTGTECIDNYNEWIEKDPEIILIRLKPLNMKEVYDKERQLLENASQVPVSDPELARNIASYYEDRGNFNKVADIYKLAIRHNKKSSALYGSLSLSQYSNGDIEDAKINTEKSLAINSKEPIALEVLCRLEADDYNWSEAKKWAKKAIDYGTKSASPYYVYAESLYKQGEEDAAEEYYNKAYNIDSKSSLAQKYKECAGCPFEVLSLQFRFGKQNGDVITDYGEKLYSTKSQYIMTRANLNVLRAENCEIQCKLFSKGKLSTGEDSKDGYTYKSELYFFLTGEVTKEIGGWGNSTPGYWPSGNYRFEIWYKGEMVGSETFVLH